MKENSYMMSVLPQKKQSLPPESANSGFFACESVGFKVNMDCDGYD
jgi:hypothetical protein